MSALVVGLVGACAEVNLDDYLHPSASPTPSAAAVPTGMVMPSSLPSVQPTTAARVSVSFTAPDGYVADAEATPSAGPEVTVTSGTWTSDSTRCSLSATLTSSPQLAVAGGDDRHLSEAWADALEESFSQYKQTSRKVLASGSSEQPYKTVSTAFVARVAGSDVTGRSQVRVWSREGAALEVTEVCQKGAFDDAAWSAFRSSLVVEGLGTGSAWPGEVAEADGTADEAASTAVSGTPESSATPSTPAGS